MRAAAIQMTSGRSVERNLADAAGLLREARSAGAELAVLPENFAFLGTNDAERLGASEKWQAGPIQEFLAAQAADNGLWLVGGTVPVRSGDKAHSASLLFSRDGELVARYDKIHLFDVAIPDADESYRESATTLAGERPVVAETAIGKIALAVCYDLRFPALFDRLGSLGMEILALPAAFTVPTGEAHWETLLKARAIEAQAFVVAAAQTGTHDSGRKTYGHSLIVGPWGEILADAGSIPGVVVADLDMMRMQRIRETFPVLLHRREIWHSGAP
ncbi:MAG TPA: carbon-nitrogen hydrolase family protein [Gammaproteobacteria bacterium]